MIVGTKVTLACGALVGITLLSSAMALHGLGNIRAANQRIITGVLPGMKAFTDLLQSTKDQRLTMLSHVASEDKGEMARLEKAIASADQDFRKALNDDAKLIATGEERGRRQAVMAAHENVLRIWDRIRPLSRAIKEKEAFALWEAEMVPAGSEQDRALSELRVERSMAGELATKGALDSIESGTISAWAAAGAGLMAGFLLSFFVVRGLNRVLKQAVRELGDGVEQITSAASQVAESSQSLALGASEQSVSIQETSATTEEITSMIRGNAEHSRNAAEVVAAVDRRVLDGNRSLEKMVNSMREISGSSGKIAKIIQVIDEIAFQTNILALNAAVEAARAGQAGMGFAVVAEEVRNLAQRSAQAAKDTESLIEDSIAKSGEGRSNLDEVTRVMSAITESAGRLKILVDEVNEGSQEQARGVEQISKAMLEVDQVTQANAATAEQTASASEEMSAQAQSLTHVVGRLRELVEGR